MQTTSTELQTSPECQTTSPEPQTSSSERRTSSTEYQSTASPTKRESSSKEDTTPSVNEIATTRLVDSVYTSTTTGGILVAEPETTAQTTQLHPGPNPGTESTAITELSLTTTSTSVAVVSGLETSPTSHGDRVSITSPSSSSQASSQMSTSGSSWQSIVTESSRITADTGGTFSTDTVQEFTDSTSHMTGTLSGEGTTSPKGVLSTIAMTEHNATAMTEHNILTENVTSPYIDVTSGTREPGVLRHLNNTGKIVASNILVYKLHTTAFNV